MGIFSAKQIELSELEEAELESQSSRDGRNYAVAGGVAQAVVNVVKATQPERDVPIMKADSLNDCRKMLALAKAGKAKLPAGRHGLPAAAWAAPAPVPDFPRRASSQSFCGIFPLPQRRITHGVTRGSRHHPDARTFCRARLFCAMLYRPLSVIDAQRDTGASEHSARIVSIAMKGVWQ